MRYNVIIAVTATSAAVCPALALPVSMCVILYLSYIQWHWRLPVVILSRYNALIQRDYKGAIIARGQANIPHLRDRLPLLCQILLVTATTTGDLDLIRTISMLGRKATLLVRTPHSPSPDPTPAPPRTSS